MPDALSKIVSVIETTVEDSKLYYTLEGVLIGSFKGGKRLEPPEEEKPKEESKSTVIRPPSPREVKDEKNDNARKIIDRAIGDKP